MPHPSFRPGFRCSVADVVVLLLGSSSAVVLAPIGWWASAMVLFVVGHFFVFCNVFRISRASELIWAAVFVVLAACTLLTEHPGWPVVFAACAILSTALVWSETRKPDYHGILWQRWNPRLHERWSAQQAGREHGSPGPE